MTRPSGENWGKNGSRRGRINGELIGVFRREIERDWVWEKLMTTMMMWRSESCAVVSLFLSMCGLGVCEI